jgi:F-type H+-transporting ATPase subunit b
VLIDWFTVTAQVINFLVLVYLLKRFLYGPIIKAMDEREKRIALRLQEAQQEKADAEQEVALYQGKNRDLENRREALLSEIKEEAETRRKELMNEARNHVDAVRDKWYEAIEREKEAFLQDLRQRAGRQTCAIARQALKDLANIDLEHHIIHVFIERLRNLDKEELEAIKESFRKSGGRINLRSAFEIPREMAQEIAKVLQDHESDPVDLRLEISSEVICGIELKVHGRKIAWSLGDYLGALEEGLAGALEGGQKD